MRVPNETSRTGGFTLIEAVISVAIVGVLLTASMTTFGAIAKSRRVQAERREAYTLAQQLMTEIMQTYFADPGASPVFGPETGETRANYDDVDDYNGLSESPPALRNGTQITDYVGWTRACAVAYVNPTSPTAVVASSTLKRITVTVTSPSGKTYVLVGLRSQYGVYEQVPSQQINYLTGVTVGVQVGSTNKAIYTGAHPLNVSTTQ